MFTKASATSLSCATGLLAHKEAQLPGGWRVRCDTEPYHKKERPVLLTLQRGRARWPISRALPCCARDGKVRLGLQGMLARAGGGLGGGGAGAGADAGERAAAGALEPGPVRGAGAAALAILFVDFTRANRAVKRIGRYLKENVLKRARLRAFGARAAACGAAHTACFKVHL